MDQISDSTKRLITMSAIKTRVLSSICVVLLLCWPQSIEGDQALCGQGRANKFQYLFGDALTDTSDCIGPMGEAYPHEAVRRLLPQVNARGRGGRTMFAEPLQTSQGVREIGRNLLRDYALANHKLAPRVESFERVIERVKRDVDSSAANVTETVGETVSNATCKSATPARLCKSSFNTTAPMYGVSLTSGNPVTIVQKFPELLQQVVYETCDTKECDLLHGECVQTYIPYLFLVIPLGPVTLTGQDYVLVESGCSCRPKYAGIGDPDPLSVIPEFK